MAGAVVSLIVYQGFVDRRLGLVLRKELATAGWVRIDVEVAEAGLRFEQWFRQCKTESWHHWSSIETIEETDDEIYFFRRDGIVLAVRKRAFESGESKEQFVELAKGLHAPVPLTPRHARDLWSFSTSQTL